MKKQTKHSIKAHLLWSALILLSLLAVCAIPFALAQRNTAKRITAEQIAAANGQKTVPLSAGAVPATNPANPASRSITSSDRSQLPQRTSGVAFGARAPDSATAENSAGSFI